jgi:hypothetical protein
MHKALFLFALGLTAIDATGAHAFSVSSSPSNRSTLAITKVYEGCGPYGHRGPYGACRRGGQWGGYIPGHSCPAGWHIGPDGRHCWPNR